MKVCIAEKPSVAQSIAAVLGANDRHQGYFEGNGFQVTWTYGHLCTLKAPDEYAKEWKRWDMRYLPMVPPRFGISLIDDEGIKKQFKVIETLYANAEYIINCGDAGQEGELIQRWVMQKAGVKCPVYRLWISSLTDDAIREGFHNLQPQDNYQNLYMAGLSRSIGDWLLGMNATRLYTIRYGQTNQRQVISIGRVQTPTLALIVKRHWEIVNFVPQQYWVIKTIYRNVPFSYFAKKTKFENKAEAEEIISKIEGHPFVIDDIKLKEGKEVPPRLYDLTSLQVDCNRKFGFSADDTLKLIQSLYEKKVTTYPRVDTTYLSDDMYQKCPNIMRGLRGYEQFTASLLNSGKPLTKSKNVFDNSKVTDHHAIIPTGVPAMNLTQWEQKVYDLVTRRFIAVFYPDCIFSTTTVLGQSNEVKFKTTGKTILKPGWRALYANEPAKDVVEKSKESKDNEEETLDGVLPAFEKGESGEHLPKLMEKWTQPPDLYTEATLLRAMETAGKLCEDEDLRDAMKENGLGRPSTRAAIIETLFKRRYIKKEKKNLIATQTGLEVIGTIKQEILKSAELTGQWEKKLRMIERGEYQPSVFYDELKTMVAQIVAEVKSDISSGRIAYVSEETVKSTPKKGKSSQKS